MTPVIDRFAAIAIVINDYKAEIIKIDTNYIFIEIKSDSPLHDKSLLIRLNETLKILLGLELRVKYEYEAIK